MLVKNSTQEKSNVFHVSVNGRKICPNWLIFGEFQMLKTIHKTQLLYTILNIKNDKFGLNEDNHWYSLHILKSNANDNNNNER